MRKHLAVLVISLGVVGACSGGDTGTEGAPQAGGGDTSGTIDGSTYLTPPPMDGDAPYGTPRYALGDAAARGLIRYEITGVDDSLSLALRIERLTDSPIDVYVVPGTVFTPAGSTVQRMVAGGIGAIVDPNDDAAPAYSVTSAYLPTFEPRLYLLDTYCLDYELANPAAADTFQLAAQPHVRAAQIIVEGQRRGLATESVQSAIWIDEDHVTKEEIQTSYDATDQEIDDAFELLKTLPFPRS